MPNLRRCEWNKSHVQKRVDLYQTGQPEADLTCYCLKNKWERTSKIVGKQGWVHTAPSFTIYVFYSVVDGAHNAQRETERTFQTAVIKTLPRVEANWKEKIKRLRCRKCHEWQCLFIGLHVCGGGTACRAEAAHAGHHCGHRSCVRGERSVGRGTFGDLFYDMIPWFKAVCTLSTHLIRAELWSLGRTAACLGLSCVQKLLSKEWHLREQRVVRSMLNSCSCWAAAWCVWKGQEGIVASGVTLRSGYSTRSVVCSWDWWCCVWVVWCYSN